MAPSELSKDRMKSLLKKIKRSHGKIQESTAYISRVPQEIRKQNKSAYTPRLFSIGPLHVQSMDNHLQSHMENIKRSYVYELLRHVAKKLKLKKVDAEQLAEKLKGLKDVDARKMAEKLKVFEDVDAPEMLQDGDATEELLSICMEQMEKLWIKQAKSYYPEEADKAVTAERLVIDGCFIIRFLHKCKWGKEYEEDMVSPGAAASSSSLQTPSGPFDPILDYPTRLLSVFRDLLLLENQLPFFVLDNLFCLTLGLLRDDESLPLGRYILDFFCRALEIGHYCILKQDQPSDPHQCCIDVDAHEQKPKYVHMLHVLHDHYLARPPSPSKKTDDVRPTGERKDDDDDEFMPSASVLDAAAVKFVVPEDGFTVNFVGQRWCCHRAHFKIPTLSIDDNTEAVFRNFIAFEQCSPSVINRYFFTSYAFLMDKLVNTEADAQVLEEAKVIENSLGSRKDVPLLFNKLCKEVSLEEGDNLFLEQCKNAANYNKHHRRAWLLVIGQYLHRRWSATPYTFIAFVVAFLVFGMQVAGFIINLTRR